ncbi:MAG: beta-mannosidase [Reichenbachiella sp.]
MKKVLYALIISVLFYGCKNRQENFTIDPKATSETIALFNNLDLLSENHTLFAHQHATEYGHGWWSGEKGNEERSDVKSVCGSHPAMIGVDFGDITHGTKAQRSVAKERLRRNVVDTYNRGGVTTAAWHFSNPLSEGGFYWKDSVSIPSVKYLIPGGEANELYKGILKDIAEWANSLKGKNGSLAPVIFRPYHEFDGSWFWWGKEHCTKDEFISLWKFTTSYLRDSLEVHNFLYAFSPDNNFKSEEGFLERYPGDEWVDMVGMDNYADMGRDRYAIDTAAMKLKIISDYAIKHQKLAAFTETGLESIPDTTWWTETLLRTMRIHDLKMSYVLVWRNDIQSSTHYYAPFPGQVSAPNFMEFYNDDYTLFENDLENIYGHSD